MFIVAIFLILLTTTIIITTLFFTFHHTNNKKALSSQLEQLEKNKPITQEKIVFTGLVRNCIDGLPTVKQLIKGISEKYSCVFMYDNCTDGSKEFLETWQQEEKDKVVVFETPSNLISTKRLSNRSCDRIQIMSGLRDHLRKYIEENYKDYKYIVLVDPDLKLSFDANEFSNSINFLANSSHVSCVASNVVRYYRWFPFTPYIRDTYAYEDVDTENQTNDRGKNRIMFKKSWRKRNHRQNVISAFGGFAIYKMKDYVDVSYLPAEQYSPSDPIRCRCEHVTFHRRLRGNVVIDFNLSCVV